jgi:hypothetical protein
MTIEANYTFSTYAGQDGGYYSVIEKDGHYFCSVPAVRALAEAQSKAKQKIKWIKAADEHR